LGQVLAILRDRNRIIDARPEVPRIVRFVTHEMEIPHNAHR
jgi:hypothetical protein